MSLVISPLHLLVCQLRQLVARINLKKTAQSIDSNNIHSLQTALHMWPVGVTEVAACGEQELNGLWPFLASMTRRRKWVVLVAPPYALPMARFHRAGVDPSRFMVVRATSVEGKRWAVQQALRSRDCGAVLFWSMPLEASQRLRLEAAALEGEASCIGFIESFNQLIPVHKAA
jgi:cell division inhibitor SulA